MRKAIWSTLLAISVAACGGGGGGGGGTTPPANYTVGGNVTGLGAGASVVLQNNGTNNLTVSANSAFVFSAALPSGSAYTVTVLTQPTGQTCTVTGGTGTVTANVTSVAVTCVTNTYTIGGNVTGLATGASVVLQNNGGDNLTVTANAAFTFATKIANGNTYNVTVLTQPTGQTCSVSTGSGTVSANNVTNVAVTCSTLSYSVGGNLSGLGVGKSVVLQNNNGDNLTLTTSGAFAFATAVAYGSPYSVTVLTQPVGQSCSIANGTGTIAAANVTNVAVTCTTNTYTIGGTATGLGGSAVLQDNGGDNLTVSTNGAFTFTTALPWGSTYNVTLLSQQFPNQTCSILGGSGTVTANVTSVSLYCVKYTIPRYAYSANFNDNSISTYVTDSALGRLKYIAKVAAGTQPRSVAVDPSGRYVYAANYGSTSVSQYSIGTDGKLTQIAAAVGAGTNPFAVIVDPSGKYVYVTNAGGNTVSQYTIGATGALTAMTPATVATGLGPNFLTFDPSGKYLYVVNATGNSVSQYTIGANGALAPMTPATVGAGTTPYSITIDPTGTWAFVSNFNGGNISQYMLGAGGALGSYSPGPVVAAGTQPTHIAVDRTGKYAYVANYGSTNVSQYTITSVGLSPMTPATIAAGTNPNDATVDPSGNYVYVANSTSNDVAQYAIGASGALTPLSVAFAPGQAGVMNLAIVAGTTPVQATPQYAYALNADYNSATQAPSISQYTVGTGGALAAMATPSVALSSFPQSPSMAVDPTGSFAYVGDGASGIIEQFTIGAGGALAAMATPTVQAVPGSTVAAQLYAVAVHPSGRYAYAVNLPDNLVAQYTVGASGALTAMATATVATGTQPYAIAIDPSGKYAYVANFGGGSVSQYTIGTNGALTAMATATVAAGTNPASVAVDPSGRYVYVTNYGSGNVSQYTIGANGALTAMATATVAAGTNPISVSVDPKGYFVYVTNRNTASTAASTVSQYSIGASGALSAMATATVATGPNPVSVAVDPSGAYVYVANERITSAVNSTLNQFSIGAGGALAPMATPTVAAGKNSVGVVTTGTWQ